MSEWSPLSQLAELKGIFATAFDAVDQIQTKGKASTTHGAATATAAASASSSSSGVVDPAAVWYYTDKNRAQQGPVTPNEITRLYGLLLVNDASLVYCCMNPSVGWSRLAETPPFDTQVGPQLIDQYAKEREEQREKEEKKQADKKRKREKQKASAATNEKWKSVVNNTSVYFTGLPPDVTTSELEAFAKKAGIILEDDTGMKRVKLYLDPVSGLPKGDATVKYAMVESVELAMTLLDQAVFRPAKIPPPGSKKPIEKEWIVTVQKAEFTQKDKTNPTNGGDNPTNDSSSSSDSKTHPSKKSKKHAGSLTSSEIAKHKLRESLSWDDDPISSSKLKIVILKPLWTQAQLDDAPSHEEFYSELRNDISDEIEAQLGGGEAGKALRGGRGCIEKLTIFEGNSESPAAVKFRDSQHAARCIQLMNGRYFGGTKLNAFYFDGHTNYVVKKKDHETPEEEERRLKEFGDWIEGGEGEGGNEEEEER